MDIRLRNTPIKHLLLLIPEMSQPIPLRRDLRVERPNVVVDRVRSLGLEFLMERRALEECLLLFSRSSGLCV